MSDTVDGSPGDTVTFMEGCVEWVTDSNGDPACGTLYNPGR